MSETVTWRDKWTLLNGWIGELMDESLSCMGRWLRTLHHWRTFVIHWRDWWSKWLQWMRRGFNWSKDQQYCVLQVWPSKLIANRHQTYSVLLAWLIKKIVYLQLLLNLWLLKQELITSRILFDHPWHFFLVVCLTTIIFKFFQTFCFC
jgi:hypothetical protein